MHPVFGQLGPVQCQKRDGTKVSENRTSPNYVLMFLLPKDYLLNCSLASPSSTIESPVVRKYEGILATLLFHINTFLSVQFFYETCLKSWAEIHQSLQSQFSLLEEFFTVNRQSNDKILDFLSW